MLRYLFISLVISIRYLVVGKIATVGENYEYGIKITPIKEYRMNSISETLRFLDTYFTIINK